MIGQKFNRSTIYNCDCFDLFEKLEDKSVNVVFTSPPYNSQRFKKYDKFSDNYKDYFSFLKSVINECLRVSEKYVILNLQTNYYNKRDVYKIIGEYSDKIQRIVLWVKPNPAPSSLRNRLTNTYEYFLILTNGNTVKCNSIFLKDVIEYPVNAGKSSEHKAAMNKDVCAFFVKEFTNAKDIIFDPFMGTGTTAIVCAENGRRYIGAEIVKEYCDIANERISKAVNVNV